MSRFRCWRAGSLSIARATSRAILVSAIRSSLGCGDVGSVAIALDWSGATARVTGSAHPVNAATNAITRTPSPCVRLIKPPRRVVRLVKSRTLLARGGAVVIREPLTRSLRLAKLRPWRDERHHHRGEQRHRRAEHERVRRARLIPNGAK